MVCLDLDEEAKFISSKVGCSFDVAKAFVDLEDTYFELLGLNVYDVDSLNAVAEKPHSDAAVVEEDELLKFICSKSEEISENLCETMLEAEHEYFVKIGIMDEF